MNEFRIFAAMRDLSARMVRIVVAVALMLSAITVVVVLFAQLPLTDWILISGLNASPTDWLKAVIAAGPASFYVGAALTRILARAIPLNADGRRRWLVIVGLASALVGIASPLALGFWPNPKHDEYIETLQRDMDLHPWPDDSFDPRAMEVGLDFMGKASLMSLLIPFTIIGIVPLLWTITRHLRLMTPRGVLFLRRFGGSGDAALTPALLRLVPRGVPVALIATPGFRPSSWDPLFLCFAGLRWFRPWADIPLFLRCSDRMWQEDVRSWVDRSTAIVLDVSERSTSVETEVGIIEAAGAGARTLWLQRAHGQVSNSEASLAGRPVTSYRLAWTPALPRIVVGVACSIAAGYLVFEMVGAVAGAALGALLFGRPALAPESKRIIRDDLLCYIGARRNAAR